MNRRDVLKAAFALPFLSGVMTGGIASALAATGRKVANAFRSRVRPGDPGWPSLAEWAGLKNEVGGRLLKLQSPFADPNSAACHDALKHIKNPFFIGDEPALTQTSGWADAWVSRPSAYAVAAESTADV
ncbi:MAG TPA: FAD-linked oxidoreductase, partial [Dyella sp.]|nr:FAD-linked oxidoreductase [Dyella sp.]